VPNISQVVSDLKKIWAIQTVDIYQLTQVNTNGIVTIGETLIEAGVTCRFAEIAGKNYDKTTMAARNRQFNLMLWDAPTITDDMIFKNLSGAGVRKPAATYRIDNTTTVNPITLKGNSQVTKITNLARIDNQN